MDEFELAKDIRDSVLNFVEASDPARFYAGTVKSTTPRFTVSIDELGVIDQENLFLCSSVMNLKKHFHFTIISKKENAFPTSTRANGVTYAGIPCIIAPNADSHQHEIQTPDDLTVEEYNQLKDGDKVLVVQIQKSQLFVILDRIYPAKPYTNMRYPRVETL